MQQEIVFDPQTASHKKLVWWLYIFHGASLVLSLGMLSWLPLIMNYVKREEAQGTFLYSHHSWQIRSFWWYLFWMALGGLFFITLVGIPVAWLLWFAAPLWKAYRIIKGFVDLDKNKIMP